MLLIGFGVNQDVIDEYDNKLIKDGWNTRFIKSIKSAGALVNPKGSTKNSKFP